MDHAAQIDGVRAEIAAMAEIAAGADLAARVPGCPDWDLAELIRHTGRVHRWVTEIVRTRATERLDRNVLDFGLPDEPAGLPDWLAAGADPLLAELCADPATEVWNFTGGGHIGWWRRRMLQETAVHRADAELALNLDPVIAPDVAADGIAELLDVLLPATGAGAKVRAMDRVGQSLHLHATDAAGEWTITLTENGYDWTPGHTKATAAVRGPLGDLLLLMWSRRDPGDTARFEIFGEPDLVRAWTNATGL